jgi:hypothetical protein
MALRTAAAALALAVLLFAGTLRAHAQESTPTVGPTVGPPPTPPAGAPAAPTNLVLLGYVAYWEDNSDNEDGFRLRYRVFIGEAPDRRETYEAPANATTFALPPDAPRLCGEGGYYALDLQIVAFNEAGESAIDTHGVLAECELAPDPGAASPTVETELPATGLRSETTSWRSPYLQTIVASFLASTVVLGLALRAGGRRR